VGLAYKLAFREAIPLVYRKNNCTPDSFNRSGSEGANAFCYPWKVFASLKFSPDASQTFNGFTYGLSHAVHRYLDIMVGLSYSAHNEVAPGFQLAAVNTVKIQQAANNPFYAQWDVNTLQKNGATAYDGFPTQLLKADGTTGSLIYSGTPLVVHYHSGFFMGISVPLQFKNLLAGSN
jgi:hypothetical protein